LKLCNFVDMRTLFLLACVSAAIGFRVRQRGNRTEVHASDGRPALLLKGPSLKGADCDQLSGIVVGGRDIGQAAVLLCRFWPAQFGDFPVDTTKTLVDLFNGATDLWRKIQELLKGTDSPFCWKKMGLRPLVSQTYMHGFQVDTAVTAYGMNSSCEMDFMGKCYGACPRGMDEAALIGGFSPVCSSSCIQSGHQTPCGFGCATDVGTCVQTLMNQLQVVANNVAAVASYLSGNPLIHQVVDKVLRLVELAIDVVFDVVAVAKHVWKEWPREQVELGVIIALLQFVLEHAKPIGSSLTELNGMFGETMEMILELIDAEFDWKEIDLKFISDTILKHGMAILGAAGEFAEAFVFPACKVVSDSNPDYDCNGNGKKECGNWDYWGLGCEDDTDRGGPCEYSYKFGDVLLDHSCRCRDDKNPGPTPCYEYNFDYPGSDLHSLTPWTASSAEDCQRKCEEHSQCQFFTYNFVNPLWNCFLKSSSAGRTSSGKHTSGPKRCQ